MTRAVEFLSQKGKNVETFITLAYLGGVGNFFLPSTGGSSTFIKPKFSLGRIGGGEVKNRRI